MALLLSVLEQGMIYGILALGVYITYKILDFPDLTVDGSFPFGAAITVRLINGFGVPAILTLPIAFLGGALVGICTGLIHVKLKVRDLLSGIIMMTGITFLWDSRCIYRGCSSALNFRLRRRRLRTVRRCVSVIIRERALKCLLRKAVLEKVVRLPPGKK